MLRIICQSSASLIYLERGDYGELLDTPEQTEQWRDKLMTLLKARKK